MTLDRRNSSLEALGFPLGFVARPESGLRPRPLDGHDLGGERDLLVFRRGGNFEIEGVVDRRTPLLGRGKRALSRGGIGDGKGVSDGFLDVVAVLGDEDEVLAACGEAPRLEEDGRLGGAF